MAYVKLAPGKYPDKSDVVNLAYYIADVNKCENIISGGLNIISAIKYNPELVTDQFFAIQQGERFERRVYHIIVNFDCGLDQPDLKLAYQVGQAVINMYPDYQSVFTVHEDKQSPHLHIMINNCPVYPDKPKLTGIFNLPTVRQVVDEIIDHHVMGGY